MTAPVLSVTGVEKSFSRGFLRWRRLNQVLRGVSFELERGTMVGLVGENGSGKSVLMKIIAGSMRADRGTVTMNGRLGYCPQIPMLYDKLTCDETFRLFGHAYGLDDTRTRERAAEMYRVLAFERFHAEMVEHLSGGTRQKLNLAVALLHDPDLILLDEPYSGFDWETYQAFWGIADTLRGEQKTILIISHFIQERSHFDRILQLRGGILESESA
jgi:ABC-type multidrug transport system ATPase subunit